MTDRWQLWFAAVAVTVLTIALAVLDLVDRSAARWWERHAFTTSATTGVLVLLITVLVINQVLTRRQLKDREQAVAAQAALLMGQAVRASRAATAALDGSGDRDAAGDEARTYSTMLLVAAPLLIDAVRSRAFLEDAQWLAGVIAYALGTSARTPESAPASIARLQVAGERLRASAQPLIAVLNLAERLAADAVDGDGGQPSAGEPQPADPPASRDAPP